MKYQKLLIVSDNLYICKQISEILKGYQVVVKFAHSPGSPLGYLTDLTGSQNPQEDVLNLKENNSVLHIIDHYDLVFSIHCKQLFPVSLLEAVKCINLHPGFNPINRGWYPQVFAILNGTILGATIHEITEELDNGPIIDRETVNIYDWDTSLSAYNRVVEKEIELFARNIPSILKGSYTPILDNDSSFISLKKDYNRLLKIDLERMGTFKEFLNYLRALTHPPYSNAYFLTEANEKVYVELKLRKESE